MASPTMLRLVGVVELSSDSSERRRQEPKCWLKFDDVVHCQDVESFNAFVGQFLTERGLVGESSKKWYFALLNTWKKGTGSGR